MIFSQIWWGVLLQWGDMRLQVTMKPPGQVNTSQNQAQVVEEVEILPPPPARPAGWNAWGSSLGLGQLLQPYQI